MQHHIRGVAFGEDTSTSRTGHGQTNLRGSVINAIKDAGYLDIPEGRRDHVRPIDALYLHGLLEWPTRHGGFTPESSGSRACRPR